MRKISQKTYRIMKEMESAGMSFTGGALLPEYKKMKTIEEIVAPYDWLCYHCMKKLTGIEPDMGWPNFKPDTCDRCKHERIVFVTKES